MTISSVKTGEDSYDVRLSNPASGIGRAVFVAGRGTGGSNTNVLDYVSIATTGNATDFGDLAYSAHLMASCSSNTRGIAAGGSTDVNSNTINYFTIASAGNAVDFGDLATGYVGPTGFSNQTRGVFAGGYDGSVRANMTYITIASLGNSTTFGNLTAAKWQLGATSNAAVGVIGGQSTSPTLERVVIATTGNATDFGNLSVNRWNFDGSGSETRGIFAGGYHASTGNGGNTIDYVTYSSSGGATDFGDLVGNSKPWGSGVTSSQTRGVISLGNEYTSGVGNTAFLNIIEYVTIASTGNATDFGDLTVSRGEGKAVSDVHGGLYQGTIDATDAITPNYEYSQGVGIAAGGLGEQNVIDYFNISTLGNAADFGDLTSVKMGAGVLGSATRSLIGAGRSGGSATKNINYVTFASTGNGTNFGDLITERTYVGAASNETRGLFSGGYRSQNNTSRNEIEYVTIATTGNALDFGDLVYGRNNWGGIASSTRAIWGGGNGYPTGNDTTTNIDYVTIASTGNATTFGQLLAEYSPSGMSNHIRGIFSQDSNGTYDIQYITIATTGNAIDFGDLTQTTSSNYSPASLASKIKGVICGGASSNVIQCITIATTGNSTDFGDLTVARGEFNGASNSHGGL